LIHFYKRTAATVRLGVRVKEVVDIMYSPDNFSPPPMEDMSPTTGFPPPLDFPPDCSSPESGAADEEELEEDGDYDLTGLSDKLHTLELRKISNLPPREILELQKASEEMNSRFANSLQGMRIPGGEGMGDKEEEDSVTPPVQQFVLETESAPAPLEDLPVVDLNQNIPESISDVVEDHEQAFTLHKAEDVIQEDIPCNSCDQDMPQCDELETIYNDLNGDCDDLEENPSTQGESLKVETEAVIENVLGEELVSGSCGQTEGTGVVEGGWNAFPPNEDEDWGEPVKGGDWGDFSDLNRTVEAEGFKGEEEDDDEFGDFGEAEEAVPMASRDVTGLLERLEELRDWSDLGEILGEEGRQGETDCEKRLGQELGSQVEEEGRQGETDCKKRLGQEKWPLHVAVASAVNAPVRRRALWQKRPRHLPPEITGPSNLDRGIEFERNALGMGDGRFTQQPRALIQCLWAAGLRGKSYHHTSKSPQGLRTPTDDNLY